MDLNVIGKNENGLPVLSWGEGKNSIQTTVLEMVLGRGRIVICRYPNVWISTNPKEEHLGSDDGWCYDKLLDGLLALTNFNPLEQKQPEGWVKHLATQTYRIDGNPEYEYRGWEQEKEVRRRYQEDMKNSHV